MSEYIADPNAEPEPERDPIDAYRWTFATKPLDVYGPGQNALWMQIINPDDSMPFWSGALIFTLCKFHELKEQAEKRGAFDEEEICRRASRSWFALFTNKIDTRAEVLVFMSKWTEEDRVAATVLVSKILAQEKKERPKHDAEPANTEGQAVGKSPRQRKRS